MKARNITVLLSILIIALVAVLCVACNNVANLLAPDNIAYDGQYKTISIRVRVKGDGNKTITSEWTEWTWTNSNPV